MSALKTNRINSIEFLMCLLGICLATLLLGFAVSGIALGIFVAFTIRYYFLNRTKIRFNLGLLLPVLLYILFLTSLFWTADRSLTLKGLERTIALVVVPITFLIIPNITMSNIKIVLKTLTIGNMLLGFFFISFAVFNYLQTKSLDVFTYHELVSVLDLNAIYVSLIFSTSLFYLLSLEERKLWENLLIGFFAVLLLLLSSKMIMIVLIITVFVFIIKRNTKRFTKKRILFITIFLIIVSGLFSKTISKRFNSERFTKINEVFNKEEFGKVYYWTGSSIRLLQLRILKEQIEEESIFLKGYGLFASRKSLKEKHKNYNTYYTFHSYNYHNQYAQILSEAGILGLLLLLLLLIKIWSKAISSKDFFFIMFSVMITLIFFTESILWRQRGLFLFIIFYSIIVKVSFDNYKMQERLV